MSGTMTLDTSELDKLAGDWRSTVARLPAKFKPTFAKAGLNVKNAINDDLAASGNGGFRRIRVSYDPIPSSEGIGVEIGPRPGGANSLANLAFFGTARGGGTHRFYEHGEEELPNLQSQVQRIASELMTHG